MMFSVPTVLQIEGFRFFFFSREGTEPSHVHVEKGGGEAKFWLRPVSLAWSSGLKVREISRAKSIVVNNEDLIEAKWNERFSKAPK